MSHIQYHKHSMKVVTAFLKFLWIQQYQKHRIILVLICCIGRATKTRFIFY